MKTANEWVKGDRGLWAMTCTNESDHSFDQLVEFIRQVQLDAWASGMDDAQTIAFEINDHHEWPVSRAIAFARKSKVILHGLSKTVDVVREGA